MAAIIRPPFWVPRPSDDSTWNFILPIPSNTLNMLTSKGRPNKKFWPPHMVYNDEAVALVGQFYLQGVNPTLFSLISKGPPAKKYWPPHLVYNDEAVWWEPATDNFNQTIQLSPKVAPAKPLIWRFTGYDDASHFLIDQPQQANTLIILIAGGKPPFMRWAPTELAFDDPPMWQGAPTASWIIPELTQQQIIMSPVFVPRPGDEPAWQATIYPNTAVTAVKPAPGIPTRARFFGYDDPAVWTGQPLSSDLLVPILTAQVPAKIYSPYTLDDPAVWTGQPLASELLHPLLTAAGKPPFKEWSYWTLDDPPSWQVTTYRNVVMLAVPFPPLIGRFVSYDDPATWDARSIRSRIIPEVTEGGQIPTKVYSFYPIDDPPSWQPTIYRNLGMALITPEPYIPMLGRFASNDDPAVWTGSPLHSWIIPELTQQTPVTPEQTRFRSYDDPSFWQGTPQSSWIIPELTQGGQPPTLIFRFNSYDDPAFWQATIYRNLVTGVPVPPPFVPLTGRFVSYDDSAFWQATTYRNQVVLTPGPAPFVPLISRFASYDDPAFWYAAPLASETLPILIRGGPPAIPTKIRFYGQDDYAVWLAAPLASETLPLLTRGGPPGIPEQIRFAGNDDAAFWQATTYRDLAMLIPPTPAVPRIWIFGPAGSFQQDDATSWSGRPLASAIIDILTVGGKPFSVMYQTGAVQGNYDAAETQWQFQTPYNVNLTAVLPKPPFNNQATFFNQGAAFAYDTAEAFWVWVPPRAWAMILPAPPAVVGLPLHPTFYSAVHNFGKMGSS